MNIMFVIEYVIREYEAYKEVMDRSVEVYERRIRGY